MRRDFEILRNILLAVGEKHLNDSNELKEELNIDNATLSYHLNLLSNDAALLKAERSSGRKAPFSSPDEPRKPDWFGIQLTWEGNDFLDSIGDSKSWKIIKKSLASGAKISTTEALKQTAKGLGSAALDLILLENTHDIKAQDNNQNLELTDKPNMALKN